MENGNWKIEKDGRSSILRLPFSIALWFLPQLIILLATLFHVPLWLNLPIRMDDLVLPALLCVQILAAAMLFPVLLKDWGSTAAMIVVAWPLVQWGAFVSAVPAGQWVSGGAYLSLFLLVLGTWNRVLRSEAMRFTAAALVTAVTAGGALLAYLEAEFSGRAASSIDLGHRAAWSPLLGILSQLQAAPSHWVWIPLGIAFIVALLVLVAGHYRTSNDVEA
jgi:hypothetical protein